MFISTIERFSRLLIVVAMLAATFITSAVTARVEAAPVDCSRGVNLSFEDPVIPSNWTIVPTPGWSTTDSGVEIWRSGFLGAVAPHGAQLAELQGNDNSANWQDIPTLGGDQIAWSFHHRGRSDADRVIVRLGSTSSQTDEGDFTTGVDAFVKYGDTYVVPDGQTTTRFVLDPVDTGSVGNLVDLVAFVLTCDLELESAFTGSTDTDLSGSVTTGDIFEFTYTVTNTGTATLTSIGVSDSLGETVVCEDATLTPGSKTTCAISHVVTQLEIDTGTVASGATVSGTDAAGISVKASDKASTVVEPSPTVSLEKHGKVDPTVVGPHDRPDAGDAVWYSFVVTNTGNVTLSAITIDDPDLDAVKCPDTPVAPDDHVTCKGVYTITQGDIDLGTVTNTATASALPPVGDAVEDTDSFTVDIEQHTTLWVGKKTAASSYETLGEQISYSIAVTNTGNVELVDVTVTDENADPGSITCSPETPASLLPGHTTTCTAIHTVTQEDLDSGSISNVASASGTGRLNDVVASDDSDSVVVKAIQNYDIDVTKVGESTPAGDGTFTAAYTLTVTNPGNVTARNIQISDDLLAVFGGASFTVDRVASTALTVNPAYDGVDDINLLVGDDTLAPGAEAVVRLDVTIDPNGEAGPFTNLAAVSSDGDLEPVRGFDVADVTFDVSFDLTIDKRVKPSVAPGDDVTWTLEIGNSGPSAVLGPITVTDKLDDRLTYVSGGGAGWTCSQAHGTVTCVTDLPIASGDSTIIEIVTTVDAALGEKVTNAASVTSADAGNESDPSDNLAVAAVTVDSLPMTGIDTADFAAIAFASILLGLVLLMATGSRGTRRQT